MEYRQKIGLISIIIGLIFIIFPAFSLSLVSVIVGLAVLIPAIGLLIVGLRPVDSRDSLNYINILIGIIGLIIGLVFVFDSGALSVITALQFYIMGFILIFLSITGYFGNLRFITGVSAAIMGIFGIILLIIGSVAAQPLYLALIIGVCFMIQGMQTYIE